MSDEADRADVNQAQHLAASLLRVSAAIPAGSPGECEDCGEDMPRLVDGRCGFCRDGRRPPASAYPDPARVAALRSPPARAATRPAAPLPSLQKETSVPAPNEPRQFSFSASGDLRAAIEARADREGIALGRAAQDLVEAGLKAAAAGADDRTVDAAEAILATLADAPVRAILEELEARLAGLSAIAETAAAIETANVRAAAAEAQLAAVRQALGPVAD